MPRNLTRGGRGALVKAEVVGIRNLENRIKHFVTAMAAKDRMAAGNSTAATIAEVSIWFRDQVRAKAKAAGWPNRLVDAIFAFTDMQRSPKGKIAALNGVKTGAPPRYDPKLYKEWTPNEGNMSRRAKRQKARRQETGHNPSKIGMSLAAMYEYGTSRMRARSAIRPAIYGSTRLEALEKVRSGLEKIVAEYRIP